MNGLHPKLEQIFAYTARRLGCTVTELQTNQSTVLPAQAPAHENFLQTTALNKRDVICVTQIAESSVIRTHPQPGGAVRLALQLVENKIFNAEEMLKHPDLEVKAFDEEPYFYLAQDDFKPFKAGTIRKLNLKDKALMDELHESIDEAMRWFVEITHPVVYGCFEKAKLVAVASHFLFEEERIAAGGVLTHPDYRGSGYGKAVSSAIMQWALDHDWICEWSSWAGNPASIALAQSLGFRKLLSDTEYQINYRKKG